MNSFIALNTKAAPAQAADDARCHGLSELERITYSQHEVANFQFVRIAERNRRQSLCGNPDQSNVGFRIAADTLAGQFSAV
jgi:hypothetical protein